MRGQRKRIEVLVLVALLGSAVAVGSANSGDDDGWTSSAPLAEEPGPPDNPLDGPVAGPDGRPLVCDGRTMTLRDAKPPEPPESLEAAAQPRALVAGCGENGTLTWVDVGSP